MVWSSQFGRWVEPDARTQKRRAKDEAILAEVEADRERLDDLLRQIREGDASGIQDAAMELTKRLMDSLIEARRESGLSQAEVAERMGVSQPAIGRLETGTHSPTLMTLARYASAIGVDVRVRRRA